jgi:hypothetical protein
MTETMESPFPWSHPTTDAIQPPEPGMKLAWRVVNPDFTSRNGYRWAFPGNWAEPNRTDRPMTTGDACPTFDGDGLCLAKTFAGAASGGIVASTALVVGYMPDDVLGQDDEKLRVRRAFVIEVLDMQRLLRDGAGASANLRLADLYSANLRSANLRSADLYSADLRSANLRSANLRSANLRSANLRSADLYSADLGSANLYSANLRSANLYSADLGSANLYSANLGSANLRSANLRSADLRSADLSTARNLDHAANLGLAYADKFTRLPEGWVVRDGRIVRSEVTQ